MNQISYFLTVSNLRLSFDHRTLPDSGRFRLDSAAGCRPINLSITLQQHASHFQSMMNRILETLFSQPSISVGIQTSLIHMMRVDFCTVSERNPYTRANNT